MCEREGVRVREKEREGERGGERERAGEKRPAIVSKETCYSVKRNLLVSKRERAGENGEASFLT